MPASPASAAPTYFVISGFPKCGNKWLQKMVFDFDSVGCYANQPEHGLPLMLRMFFEHEELQALLRREDISVRDFTVRMLDVNSALPLNFSEAGRMELRKHLRDLGLESAKIAPAAEGHDPAERFAHLLDPARTPPYAVRPWRAIGMPAMHTPVAELQRLLPDFRIINIVRDPRDITVSFFYHLLATLNPRIAGTFVRTNPKTGELEQNPRWKRQFAQRVNRRLDEYFGRPPLRPEMVHPVRYEDLLVQPEIELRRILQFLGCPDERDEVIAHIVEHRSFEIATGSREEQRNSMLRKGQAGDWRNYFDRELIDALGQPFADLVRRLGYEPDDGWIDRAPHAAPKEFDFARFRIRRSTVRAFVRYWDESPELQRRYPDSWQDIEGEDSFFGWLDRCDRAEVQEWLTLARRLEELWRVDIVEKAGR